MAFGGGRGRSVHSHPSMTYDSAVDGQGAVAQLLDPVVGLKLHALPVPLDGWGRVSSHLTIQDSITSKWLDPIRRVLTFEDGRFWK